MGNLIPAVANRKAIVDGVRANAEKGGGDFAPILKLDQDGTWKYGVEDDALEDGTKCMVIPSSFVHGWTCWKGGKPIDAKMVPIWEAVPERANLPDHGPYSGSMEGWSETSGAAFVLESGEALRYTPMSYGGRTELGDLASKFAERLDADTAEVVPVVSLWSRSYPNKKYQREVRVPVLTVEEWLDETEAESWTARSASEKLDAPVKEEPAETKLVF